MKGLIHWFIDNRVAANLLMVLIMAGGALTVLGIKLEVFPDVSPNMITISVVHPGATPTEVEEGICIKVEEAVEGLDGVKRITSTSAENMGLVALELYQGTDVSEVLEDVKTRVGAISTFPDDAEKPVIVDVESPKVVISVVVAGPLEPLALKRVAQQVRDEIAALPEISRVEIADASDYEISIEVSEDALRRYGLRFDDVVSAVRQSSLNLSGGTVRTRAGEILLRSDTQAYVGEEFERILLLKSAEGTRIHLGDVATVVDGFEDVEQWSTFNGNPALTIVVFRIGKQSAPTVAGAVESYLARKQAELPEGVTVTKWRSWAKLLHQRLTLLLENGRLGLILIFVILMLFLRTRLALWVAIGIPTCFLGALWLLPATGVTINMMSLFAFIVVLGIVIDDAIVVSENIHYHSRLGKSGPRAAKDGTLEMMVPVTLAVLTTIAAFVPMLTLPGTMGQFAAVIPVVVILSLAFSLVESLLILPKHLSHLKPPEEEKRPWLPFRLWSFVRGFFSGGLDIWVQRVYRPILNAALRWRYLTFACGAGIVILALSLFLGRIVRFTFFPKIAGDQLVASVTMPRGTAIETTQAAVDRIVRGLNAVSRHYEEQGTPVVKHVLVSVGTQPRELERNWESGKGAPTGTNLGEVFVELFDPDERNGIDAEEVMRLVREEVGSIPGARELRYEVEIRGAGAPIAVQLRGRDLGQLRAAADRVKAELGRLPGTFDILDDMVTGKEEYRLYIRPEAEALGLSQAELARQVRQGFYGDEAQRIQRGRDDVKVMVRYPLERRRSVADLENMRIRTPLGGEVPFRTVATAVAGRSPAAVHRADGGRTVTVFADVDTAVANANEIVAMLKGSFLPALVSEYPGLGFSFEGEQREQTETLTGLFTGTILALLLIYILLALAFGSFIQPVIVLLAIPFGMVGAVAGHWWMGMDLTMLSAIGLLAMAGVVVNDSMILIDFVNRARARGVPVLEAVREAGPRRFRAVLLTSLTTFAGLTPLLMETSVQAQFLIPMAISLSFGVLFSTFVTLLIVPASYLILDDVLRPLRKLGLARARQWVEPEEAASSPS